jgi:hypothetical protein
LWWGWGVEPVPVNAREPRVVAGLPRVTLGLCVQAIDLRFVVRVSLKIDVEMSGQHFGQSHVVIEPDGRVSVYPCAEHFL